MNTLKALIQEHEALIRPAKTTDIDLLQNSLGFTLSDEYRAYLSSFGVVAYDAYETYGLGVKPESHLCVSNIYRDLSSDETYPPNALPILELGDGQYYLYDNISRKIILWATPNGGVVRSLDGNLEQFLINHIFK